MSDASHPHSLNFLRRFFQGGALFASAFLTLAACHAPRAESAEGPTLENTQPVDIPEPSPNPDLSEPVPPGEHAEPPIDDFDLFEDEYENQEVPGIPFDQASLDERVAFIVPKVEELRGQDFNRHVPAAMQTPGQFIEFAMAEFESEYGMDSFEATSEAYRLLGLIEPELNLLETTLDLLRTQVGGYYDPKTKRFYMMNSFNQGAMADIILAHELTHALDDQRYDLQAMFAVAKGNADYEFAVRAVVEGSGTSLMNLFAIQGVMKGWLTLDAASMNAMMAEQAESMQDAPPYLIITLALPYLEGNKLLTRKADTMVAAMAVPDPEDLKASFLSPPKSSEQVLHFEKYWDADQLDEPTILDLPDLSHELGDGWVLEDKNVLGELGCFIMTARQLPDLASAQGQIAGRWTNDAATGWDGDLYQSYLGPDGQRLLHWTSVWDTPDDAKEFAEALEERLSIENGFLKSVARSGQVVRVAFANDKCSKSALAANAEIPKFELTR